MLKPLAMMLLFAFAIAATGPQPSAADRTAAYLESIRNDSNPTRLTEFLALLPKGGDLHHHLSGAVYAESYINYAAEDGDCFDATFTIVAPLGASEKARLEWREEAAFTTFESRFK